MARLQDRDPLKAGGRAGHGKEVEDLIDAAQVGPRRDPAAWRAMALISEANSSHSPPSGRVPGPVKRADAEAIAGQHHLAAAAVPQGQGELAVQMFEHAFLMIFPEMRNQLGVAVGGEAMAPAFEHLLGFGIIEELAVEDDGDGAILVADRLLAVGEADDAEPAIGQAEARLVEVAVIVRAAMDDGVGHAFEKSGRHPASTRQIDRPGNATHAILLRAVYRLALQER